MNIIYSSDDNYVRHVGVAITSLYDHNQDAPELNVFLIDNNISAENREKLNGISEKFGRRITYIPFGEYKDKLVLNNQHELPISSYARLFVSEMLPENVDRVLYLDCDTVVCDSLKPLFEMDMQNKAIGGVEDVASCLFQSETDSTEPYRYICAGVLLINLKKWRQINALQKMLDYLNDRNGVVRHHDQTILNGIFGNDCCHLHPRYNAMTPTFIMSYSNLKSYFKLWDKYYSQQEVRESIRNPAIIHFTSANLGRPWENSKHPKAKIYQNYWKNSPWKDAPWGTFKPYNKKQYFIYQLYQHIPAKLITFFSRSGG